MLPGSAPAFGFGPEVLAGVRGDYPSHSAGHAGGRETSEKDEFPGTGRAHLEGSGAPE